MSLPPQSRVEQFKATAENKIGGGATRVHEINVGVNNFCVTLRGFNEWFFIHIHFCMCVGFDALE